MKFSLQDEKTKIIIIVFFVIWTMITILSTVFIYRKIFVLPFRGVVRYEHPENIIDMKDLDRTDRTVLLKIFELAKEEPSQRGEAWNQIIDILQANGEQYSVLDGKTVFNNELDNKLFAVMIENSPTVQDRQKGMSKATLVWHFPTEGGIGRYLAIFRTAAIRDSVGPIRSTRPYFLEVAATFKNIPLVHAGGSPTALQMLPTLPIFDIDEDQQSLMYRDMNYFAPHNLYTYADLIAEKMKSDNIKVTLPKTYLSFSGDLEEKTEPLSVSLTSSVTPDVTYIWKDSHFERSQDGEVTTDQLNSSPVEISNVIILYADIINIPGDDQERLDISFSSSGDLKALIAGRIVEGTYTYNKQEGSFTFMSLDDVLQLVPGNTWFEVVPANTEVTIQTES